MNLRCVRLLSITLAVLALTGCLDRQRRDISLDATLRKYESTLRWGRLEDAYLFKRTPDAGQAEIPRGLGDVRVTGYEVLSPAVEVSEGRAVQAVRIQYLFRDRQVVKTLMDEQVWQYDKDADRWYLASPVVSFR